MKNKPNISNSGLYLANMLESWRNGDRGTFNGYEYKALVLEDKLKELENE